MQLPDDVLAIIREYSMPLTRPDWRTLKPLSGHLLYINLNDLRFNYNNPLYRRVFNQLIKTTWGEMYFYIRIWGIVDASEHFKITKNELYKMPGMIHAQAYYLYGTLLNMEI